MTPARGLAQEAAELIAPPLRPNLLTRQTLPTLGAAVAAAGMALGSAAGALGQSQVLQTVRVTASPTGDRLAVTDGAGAVIAQGDKHRHSEMPHLVVVPNANPALVKRYLVFNSSANDLPQMVGAADNDASQMDAYRAQLDGNLAVVAMDRVSGLGVDNTDPNHGSAFASISPDGAFVAFQSPATDLAPQDADGGAWSVFARRMDVAGAPIMLVSDDLRSASSPPATIGDCTDDTVGAAVRTDGTTTAVARDASGMYHVFWVSQAGYLGSPSGPCDDPLGPNGLNSDVFRFSFDPVTGATSRIAVSDGDLTQDDPNAPAPWRSIHPVGFPAVSADGSVVAFEAQANVKNSYVPQITDANGPGPPPASPSIIDAHDIMIAYMPDDLAMQNITFEVASVIPAGNQTGAKPSRFPALSPDGRYVSFVSWAEDLDAIDADTVNTPPIVEPDVFVRDLVLNATVMVSVGNDGLPLDGQASGCAWCRSSVVTFAKDGTDLVAAAFTTRAPFDAISDTNDAWDIYIRVMRADNLACGETMLVSRNVGAGSKAGGAPGIPAASHSPSLAWDGSLGAAGQLLVAFASHAEDLIATDGNGAADIFVAALDVVVPDCTP